ncbi:hypothetical protein [Pseudalkalibacillus decolorationis]|uniref:hypothetical protein n=1 Tax=Pseudalkalibacillus decolorationis TaxID=163879 RepID=UPI0021482B8D|nr:hypothetical protein [Pseudalkalibacillus decolorationis]
MPRQEKKPQTYEFDENGEMAVQQQIMDSYQSGVIDQESQNQTFASKRDQNKLR